MRGRGKIEGFIELSGRDELELEGEGIRWVGGISWGAWRGIVDRKESQCGGALMIINTYVVAFGVWNCMKTYLSQSIMLDGRMTLDLCYEKGEQTMYRCVGLKAKLAIVGHTSVSVQSFR